MAIQDSRTTAMLRSANRATIGATAVLLLTTVHHLYGAACTGPLGDTTRPS
jgi:hypothetical protein